MIFSVVEAKVNDFVSRNAMFTSVDIANSIKRDGTWVKNSKVAGWLRTNVLSNNSSYASIQISVAQGQHTAFLYYPFTSNPDDYDYQDRDQQALPPQHSQTQAQASHTVVTNTSPSTSVSQTLYGNQKNMKVSSDKSNRLRIPAILVKELGLMPGDKVDKTKILTNNKDLSDKLKVHKDGRIEFSRKYVAWDSNPVIASIDNGAIKFEKA